LDDFKERMQKATEVRKQGIEFVAPSAKILVVDDYKINLKVFKNLLKKTQMIIKEAESGKECIEILRSESFDMVFLDHMMPDMDGIETLQVIKEEHLCDGTPMIMLTANAIVGDREKYLKLGFDEFLSKPIVVERLEEVIMRFLPEGKTKPEETKDNDNTVTKRDDTMKFNDEKLQKLYEELPQLDFEMGLATCSGDEEFYLELMYDFVNLDIKKELTLLYEEKDFKNYCIRIHGFKNSAWSVGAKNLGDLAYEMEKGTREDFAEGISSMQKQLFEEYDKICGVYNNMIGE
jgi:CheY-like chemotaxis protein